MKVHTREYVIKAVKKINSNDPVKISSLLRQSAKIEFTFAVSTAKSFL